MKKITCQRVDLAILKNHKVKMEEIETIEKYFDLARELKEL